MSIIERIENFEDKGLWKSALDILNTEMNKEPSKEISIRRVFVCWYVLVESCCIELNEPCELEIFEENLRTATEYLLKHFSEDAEANFYLGYMISIASWLFHKNADKLESKAKRMLAFAARAEPENPIYEMVYLGNKSSNEKGYWEACNRAAPMVEKLYKGKGKGKGEFNLYFRQVLTRKT